MLEAYSVGVRVSLINGVTAGLLGMSSQFKRTAEDAALLNRRIDGIKKTMLVGGGLMLLGGGILAMFKAPLDEAKKFQTEMARFSMYGMGAKAETEAERFAKSMNVMGSSFVDNIRLINEAQGIFRESGALGLQQQFVGAKIAAPILAKLQFIESGLSPDEQVSRHAQDLAMLRFVEARGGANDPRTFSSIADWGFRLSKSSGGVVDWSQLQQMTATAGPMTRTITEDAISKLEPVIADLKGGRTGSGLRVAFQRLLGTQRVLPKQAVAEYLKLGLWDPSKVELTGQGSIKRFLGEPGSVFKGQTQFMSDPVDFYTKTFLPAIAKKYGNWILGDDVRAVSARSVEQSLIFGPGTASSVFSQIDKLLPAIQRSLGAQGKQMGIDASYKAIQGTAAGKQIELSKKFHDLMEQTGEAVLPLVVQGMETLLPILTQFSSWAQQHKTMFGDLVKGLFLFGGAALIGGAVTSIAGGVKAFGLLFSLFGGPAAMAAERGALGLVRVLPVLGTAFAGLDIAAIALAAAPWVAAAAGLALVGVAVWKLFDTVKQWNSMTGPQHQATTLKREVDAAKHGRTVEHLYGGTLTDTLRKRHANAALAAGIKGILDAKPVKPASYESQTGSRYIAPGQGKVIQVSAYTMLDGRQIAKTVTHHQAKDMARQPNGPSGFDGSLALTPVAAGYQT